MAIIKITKDNFENEAVKSDKPVLLDFWAEWCGPCRMIAPVLEEIAQENEEIKIGKINVDEQEELAAAFGISSIPTLVVMKNGKAVNKSVGFISKDAVFKLLD